MKFVFIYVIVLLALLANEVLSMPTKRDGEDFCKGQASTGGKQISEGSCSTTIQGMIPSSDKMTSSLIIFPENEALFSPNIGFNVVVAINNLVTGFFSNPENQYYSDPQTVDSSGVPKGHSHITIQTIDGLNPPDAGTFEFFEGLNDKAESGRLVASVVDKNGKPGLPEGRYRICAMSSSFTHQPLLMPIAKRGAQDDCIRITVARFYDKKNEVGKGITDNLNGKGKEEKEGKKGITVNDNLAGKKKGEKGGKKEL